MKLTTIYRYLFLLSCFGLLLVSCKVLKSADQISLVQTDWDEFNLKGEIKKLDVSYVRNYISDTMTKEELLDIEFRNDYNIREFPMGLDVFDQNGFIIKSSFSFKENSALAHRAGLENTMIIKEEDFLLKNRKFKGNKYQHYPVINIQKVHVNYVVKTENKNSPNNIPFILNYKFDYKKNFKGQIVSAKEFRSGEQVIVKEDLNIQRVNKYDKNGTLVTQYLKLLANVKNNRFLMAVTLQGMDIPVNAKVHYRFDYDPLSRLKVAELYENDKITWSEKYSYRDSSMRSYKLDRFIIASRTFGKHLTNNTSEWYNSYGDITKSVNYDNGGVEVRTRFYEYEYDDLNNWVECRMYLMGAPEKTAIPTLVANRKIEYYSSDTNTEN